MDGLTNWLDIQHDIQKKKDVIVNISWFDNSKRVNIVLISFVYLLLATNSKSPLIPFNIFTWAIPGTPASLL